MTTFVGYDKQSHHGAERPPLALQKHFAQGFDFEAIGDAAKRAKVQAHTEEIFRLKQRLACDAVAIGKILCEVREELGPRMFTIWAAASLHWSQCTLSNLMNVARKFGDLKAETLAQFDVSALYELSRERTAPAARREAIAAAESGKPVSQALAYTLNDRHADEAPRPPRRVRAAGDASGNASGDASSEAPTADDFTAAERRRLTNIVSTFRQALRATPAADRAMLAAEAIDRLRQVLKVFDLEYLLSNTGKEGRAPSPVGASSAAPRVAAAARRVREAGVSVLD